MNSKKSICTFVCILLLCMSASAQPQQAGQNPRPDNIQDAASKGQNDGTKGEIYWVGFLAMVGKEKSVPVFTEMQKNLDRLQNGAQTGLNSPESRP